MGDSTNPDALKLFYDPHPGFGGAAAPLPKLVREAAAALSGQCHPIPAVLDILQKAWSKGRFQISNNCILLTVGTVGSTMHCWRVLRFRDP